ncbi:MAG: hypothetical protein ACR2RB_05965 [Gammaproteobacteria bacterium]
MQLTKNHLMTGLLFTISLLPAANPAADCPWEVHRSPQARQDTLLFTIIYCGSDDANSVFYGLSAGTQNNPESFDLRKLVRLENGRALKAIEGYYALPTGTTFLIASAFELPQFSRDYLIEPAKQACLGPQRGGTAISGRLPAQIVGSRLAAKNIVGHNEALICRVDIN